MESEIQIVMHLGIMAMRLITDPAPSCPTHTQIGPEQRTMPQGGHGGQRVRQQVDGCQGSAKEPWAVAELCGAGECCDFRVQDKRANHVLNPGCRRQAVRIQPQDDLAAGMVVPGGTCGGNARLEALHHRGAGFPRNLR